MNKFVWGFIVKSMEIKTKLRNFDALDYFEIG